MTDRYSTAPGPTVHYFCLATTDDLNAHFDVNLPTGAAANKVWGVARALSSAGVKAVVVTGVIPVSSARLRPDHLDMSGVAVVRVFATGSRFVRRLTAMFGFAHYALRRVAAGDAVVLYNYFWDYLLAALILRLAGRPAILDIEDGPRTDEPGLRGASVRIAFAIFRRLCAGRFVTVSQSLAAELRLPEVVIVYGTVPAHPIARLRTCLTGLPISVLYSGTIVRDTGLDLFLDTVDLLRTETPGTFSFHVSGLMEDGTASQLTALGVTVHRALSQQHYADLIATADVGLSLKLSASGMGRTTFPSKVIEIAGNGLLLVTTSVSDIPLLFDNGRAVLLERETPRALANALLAIARNLPAARAVASAGQSFARSEFSHRAVGDRLRAFIFGPA